MTAESLPAARLADVVAALSMATDHATGKEPGRALSTTLVAMRIADALGVPEAERSRVYYTSLLAMLGCTADISTGVTVFGDELAFGAGFAPLVSAPRGEMMGWMLRNFAADERFARRVRRVARLMTAGQSFMVKSTAGHCEVAQRLGRRLGLDDALLEPLGSVFERWDGTGRPQGLRGEAIPLAVRISLVAWDVETFGSAGGVEAWTAILRRRAGHTLDPNVIDATLRAAEEVDAALRVASPWDALLAAEPGTPRAAPAVETVASVIADLVDMKSDHLVGHSRAVAAIASAAAAHLGMDSRSVDRVRCAGLVHDLGRMAVSTTIWDKPAPLTDAEWEVVRLHAYHGERILCRTAVFADVAPIAAAHHERCDGSGYHRGAALAQLTPEARVLGAADAFAAMTESRAHRVALSPRDAARELSAEAQRGRLDADAVAAVIAVSGEQPEAVRGPLPAGLSDREAEVVALLARGLATKQIAARLGISPKTADHHVQSGYRKIGVSTRAGATVFAMENGLLTRAV